MTMITIDPDEMSAAATTLQQCAAELAELKSQLASCVCCPMPPVVAQDVQMLMGTLNSLLDRLSAGLHNQAVGLVQRGLVATLDSLAAATGSTREAVAGQFGVDLVAIGGAAPAAANAGSAGMAIIGGQSSSDYIILNPDGTEATPYVSSGIVGGTPDYSRGSMGGVMALAEVSQQFSERAQARIDRIIANPNSSPSDIAIAMNAQSSLGDNISHIQAPSRSDLERQLGRRPGTMTDSEIRSISPFTLPSYARNSG